MAYLSAASPRIRTEDPTVLPVKFYNGDFTILLYEGELHWDPNKPTELPTFSLIDGEDAASTAGTDEETPQNPDPSIEIDYKAKDDDNDIKHTHEIISTLEVPLGFSCSPSELEGAILPWFRKEMAQVRRNNKEWPCCSETGCGLPLKVQIWMWEGAPRIVLACEKYPPFGGPGPSYRRSIQTFLSERGLI